MVHQICLIFFLDKTNVWPGPLHVVNFLFVILKDEKKVTKGTRVVRGPDWQWGDQGANGEGTVIEETLEYSEEWLYGDM